MALDFRFCGASAHFRIPEVELGMNMSWGSIPRMLALMGPLVGISFIGAVRTYRRIYRSSLDPMKVAELMMLRRDVPRSVHHCLWMVDLSMAELAETYGTRGEADRVAGELHARLRYARIDQVFEMGLHTFLGGVRGGIATLSDEIGRQFLLD